MKMIAAISFVFVCSLNGFGQRSENEDSIAVKKETLPLKVKIKYADALFGAGNYFEAIVEYQEILSMKPENLRSAYQIGECYFKSRDYVNAEKWYQKVIDAGAESDFPLAFYRLAMMQKMQGNYEQAKYSFAKFALRAQGNDMTRAKREIEACDFAKSNIETPSLFQVTHLGESINSPYSEYAPAVADGKLYYSSLNRDTAMNPSGKFLSHIYIAEKNSAEWKKGTLVLQPNNSDEFHTGNVSFSTDGKRMYFTRCTDNGEANIRCKLFLSVLEKGVWMQPVPLSMQQEEEAFSNTHPAADGGDSVDVVYFSSNRPGGYGGFDLWYTEVKRDGSASEPVNLGSAVNTIDDEMTPFFTKNKLYFSSDGHIGFGGLDVFVSSGLKNGWSKPQNLGYPLNSSADDLYFAKGESPKVYYLVSNRTGTIALKSPNCCDDIFMVQDLSIPKFQMKGKIFEKGETDLLQLTGARVEAFEITQGSKSALSDKVLAGDYEFSVEMTAGKDYELKVQKKGYFPQTIQISSKENPEGDNISREILLEKIEKKKAYRLDKIYYEFNKSSLTEESKATLQKLHELLVENPKLVVEIGSHTDDVGKPPYNLKLSQERAQSVVDYLVYLGIESKRLIPKGYGETLPIAPNKLPDGSDNEAGRQQNRRTEFKVVGELSRVGDKIIFD